MSEDKFQHARGQAQAQFDSIRELVDALNVAQEAYNGIKGGEASQDYHEAAVERIQEDALEVCVRDGWRTPGAAVQDGPDEYYILLSTGGPAVRIVGELNKYSEPETARLEMQDWFTPWTEYRPELKQSGWDVLREQAGEQEPESTNEILLTYARQFYFGE